MHRAAFLKTVDVEKVMLDFFFISEEHNQSTYGLPLSYRKLRSRLQITLCGETLRCMQNHAKIICLVIFTALKLVHPAAFKVSIDCAVLCRKTLSEVGKNLSLSVRAVFSFSSEHGNINFQHDLHNIL